MDLTQAAGGLRGSHVQPSAATAAKVNQPPPRFPPPPAPGFVRGACDSGGGYSFAFSDIPGSVRLLYFFVCLFGCPLVYYIKQTTSGFSLQDGVAGLINVVKARVEL